MKSGIRIRHTATGIRKHLLVTIIAFQHMGFTWRLSVPAQGQYQTRPGAFKPGAVPGDV